jgi:oligosaccharyltransferase complex subunit alpha (ribophorin I)
MKLALFTLLSTALCFVPPKTWENTLLTRSVDLSKAYLREDQTIEIRNIADVPNSEYYIAVPNYVYDKLSVLSVYPLNNGKKLLKTEYVEESGDSKSGPVVNYVKVELPPIAPKSTYKLGVSMSITNVLEPLPAKIGMIDEQTLLLRTVKKPLSAYDTLKSKLKFIGVTQATELTDDEQDKGVVENQALTFSFDSTGAFQSSPMALLYKFNNPLLKINKLNRGVWISHWGDSIQFVEEYETTNEAAHLNKGFSRADFMLNKANMRQTHALTAMELDVEDDARDLFFTDLVGNVSTSRGFSDKLFIKPRFPVFGGWHYNFTIGWTNDLGDYLKKLSDDEYVVRVPFLNGPPGSSYDEVSLNIYLPEGAKVLEVECPIEYQSQEIGYELSYFDLGNGHTKVTLEFENMVDSLGKLSIVVKYQYGIAQFMTKPLNAAKYVFVALLAYLALTRVDLTLKAKK